MMVPLLLHEPPRPFGASHSTWMAPLLTCSRFSLPSAKNAREWLSPDSHSFGKECERVAVGRPESGYRGISARNHARPPRIQIANPRLPASAAISRDERE